MRGSHSESETHKFACSLLGDTALVELTYQCKRLPGGKDLRVLNEFRCENSDECGVASVSPNGRSKTYDWSKCVHPNGLASR
jgi:hypothetical protein